MTVQFVPRIRYGNKQQLSLKLYPNLKVPVGVSARAPHIISQDKMVVRARNTGIHKGLTTVAGLTEAQMSLSFANPKKQWKQMKRSRARSGRGHESLWKFQGGCVYVDLTVTIYVSSAYHEYAPQFAFIMEHEYLHVSDEIDIITRHMPLKLKMNPTVKGFLIKPTLAPQVTYEWFCNGKWSEAMRMALWVVEHNKKAATRDTGPAREEYQKKFEQLSFERQR